MGKFTCLKNHHGVTMLIHQFHKHLCATRCGSCSILLVQFRTKAHVHTACGYRKQFACDLPILLLLLLIKIQDRNSSRLPPGSSCSCCICNLHALVYKQCHPVNITTAHEKNNNNKDNHLLVTDCYDLIQLALQVHSRFLQPGWSNLRQTLASENQLT
jgi:hypothetical protein